MSMIEINLLPGSAKRTRRKVGFSLPKRTGSTGASSPLDPFRTAVIAAWIVAPLLLAWLFLGARNRTQELEVAIEGAVLDSARYATIIAANRQLNERQALVAEKLSIIQEVDQARYVWAHILDEASRALPQHTWLVDVSDISREPASRRPRISINGRAGNTYALTQYMEALEASPFLGGVTLIDHYQLREGERVLYSFVIEMNFTEPGPDAIRTVPIFADLSRE